MEHKTKRDDRYIQPPLCLLQETYNMDERGWNIILDFGIVNFAKKQKYNMADVARQLMYAYYRKSHLVQSDLFDTLNGFIDDESLTTDDDYNGFSGPSFFPEESIHELQLLFESHSQFKRAAIFCYQITQAADFLNITLGSLDSTIENYNKGLSLQSRFEAVYGPDCCPGIKPSQIIEFRDTRKDIDLLRAYIGIKSLIGQNNYVSTHKSVILSRMLGCKSNDSLQAFLQANKNAKKVYEMYSGRKRMDNLLFKLMERGFIIVLSKKHESRIYVSAKLKTPTELANAILKYRKSNDLKKQISEASNLL
jgi:hypothetical protein